MQIETKRWPWSAIGDPQHQQVGERKMQTVPDANASKSLNPHHYMWSFFFSNNFLKFFNHKHFKIALKSAYLLKNLNMCCFSACIPIGQHQWEPVLALVWGMCSQQWHRWSFSLPVVLKTVMLPSLPQPCPPGHLCLTYLLFCFSINLILGTL